jgi:hypothetical protein
LPLALSSGVTAFSAAKLVTRPGYRVNFTPRVFFNLPNRASIGLEESCNPATCWDEGSVVAGFFNTRHASTGYRDVTHEMTQNAGVAAVEDFDTTAGAFMFSGSSDGTQCHQR